MVGFCGLSFFFLLFFHWTHLILLLVLYHNLHYIYRESEISTGLVGGWGRTRQWAKTYGFWMIFMFTFLLLVNLVQEGKYEFNILPSVCIFSHASNSGSLISSGYLLNAFVDTWKLFVNLDNFGKIMDRNQVQLKPFKFVCQYVIDFHVLNIMSILA